MALGLDLTRRMPGDSGDSEAEDFFEMFGIDRDAPDPDAEPEPGSDADVWVRGSRDRWSVAPGTGELERLPFRAEPGVGPGVMPGELELPEGYEPGDSPYITEVGAEKEVKPWYSNPWLWGGIAAAGALTVFLATRK